MADIKSPANPLFLREDELRQGIVACTEANFIVNDPVSTASSANSSHSRGSGAEPRCAAAWRSTAAPDSATIAT